MCSTFNGYVKNIYSFSPADCKSLLFSFQHAPSSTAEYRVKRQGLGYSIPLVESPNFSKERLNKVIHWSWSVGVASVSATYCVHDLGQATSLLSQFLQT